MRQTVILNNVGKATLHDNNFIGSGGEAEVYKHNQYAVKLFHDKHKAISPKKVDELNSIHDNSVLIPIGSVFDSNNQVVGYYMKLVMDGVPICKLFTKSFKKNNNISNSDIKNFVSIMSSSIFSIHKANCVVGDLNEMNVLSKKLQPMFIDVDSYQTKSFPCTAVAETIRDRTVSFGTFNIETDWFAFAVLSFQLYIGIHPYKGKHPNYKITEWQKRMDDGVSVFNKKVSLPKVCNSLSVIPKNQLKWFEGIFTNQTRSPIPNPDSTDPVAIETTIITVSGDDNINVMLVDKIQYNVKNIVNVFGNNYYLTNNGVIFNNKTVYQNNTKAKLFVIGHNGNPFYLSYQYKTLQLFDHHGNKIFEITAEKVLVRENNVYFLNNNNLFYVEIAELPNKFIASAKLRTQIYSVSAKFFKGVIYQRLPRSYKLYIPYPDKVETINIPELKKHRVIEIRMIKNICVIVGEQNHKYDMFIVIIENNTYSLRKLDNINYYGINFTVMDNGVCILFTDNEVLEIFKDNTKTKVLKNTSIDSSMTLFSNNNKVFIVSNKEVFQISLK